MPVSSRNSRTGNTRPVVQRTCDNASRRVRKVTAARIASGSGATTTTFARDAASAPRRPKCSSVVVMISSLEPSSSPERTMLQPSVVLAVSAMWSGSAETSEPTRARTCSRSSIARAKYDTPLRPSATFRSSSLRMASKVGAAIGPNVPAFR